MRFSSVPQFGEDFEYLAFQGMVRACHANLRGEVSEVGSVSYVPSITCLMRSSWKQWRLRSPSRRGLHPRALRAKRLGSRHRLVAAA